MKINPALLVDTKKELIRQILEIEKYTDEVDIDIIDWSYTNLKTISIETALHVKTDLKLNFDLMMNNPNDSLELLIKDDRVQNIILNIRALDTFRSELDFLYSTDKRIGISLNPENTIGDVEPFMDKLEIIQIYTVEPGAQGNPFLLERLKLITQLRETGYTDIIEIDGGINEITLPQILKYSIDIVSVGSALSKADNPAEIYTRLQNVVRL